MAIKKYSTALMNSAAHLDTFTNSEGEIIKLALNIVDYKDETSVRILYGKISSFLKDTEVNQKDATLSVKNDLITYLGYYNLGKILKNNQDDTTDTRSLTELLAELDALVGLDVVKTKVNDLITFQKIQKLRLENDLHSTKNTLHLAFTGNPGTGKTTVARIVGHIYKQIGLLSKGHFVEVSRTDLIAGYQGQTALKVKNVIEKAKGGVLFIDEAYSITENDHSDSYGRECLTELTKALEDYREDLVVIVAGYTEPMKSFFASNPGLRSRFNTFIEFPDYSSQELEHMLVHLCKNNDYLLDDCVLDSLRNHLSALVNRKESNFANGRIVRNIYDDLVMNHAKRVDKIQNPTKEDLSTIKDQDFTSPIIVKIDSVSEDASDEQNCINLEQH
jgi:SpoVK/Ycf46/Vps4 family AAA+-type ATPase